MNAKSVPCIDVLRNITPFHLFGRDAQASYTSNKKTLSLHAARTHIMDTGVPAISTFE